MNSTSEMPGLDSPATTTHENIEQSKFWAGEIGWAVICDWADRNMDLVHFPIDFGCPECGGAWTDLLAVGYTSDRRSGGEARWDGRGMHIRIPPINLYDFRAARIACCSGHMFNYDSYTRRIQKYQPSPWSMAAVGLGIYAIGALGYMLGKSGLLGKAR